MSMKELVGRKVLASEVGFIHCLEKKSKKLVTMRETNATDIQCLRCGAVHNKKSVLLEDHRYYCPSCIQLGRVDSRQNFYHLSEGQPIKRELYFGWAGKLTKGQKKISDALLQTIKKKESRLIWAVTGAGKTEMLFKAIHYSLEQGYRVAIASPRVDVCIELYPRIQNVFKNEDIILLHGRMEEVYRYTKLLICTTHQLLRFYKAFDVLIIDEVDAFPFVNNKQLAYGVSKSLKPNSSLIYLTATPTRDLLKKTEQKKLLVSILPGRYHRRKLPIPELKWCSNWEMQIKRQQFPKALNKLIRSLVQENDVLIFCPSIFLMHQLENILKRNFSEYTIASVHAQDSERLDKVAKMREKNYKILLTSTILERGVTFDTISVIVLGANHPVFSTSTLVQIAGRVDRKSTYTNGKVWFVHDGKNRSMKEAIRQIKWMNQLAIKRGIVDEM